MRLYIAGPMRGIEDWNFPSFFAAQAVLVQAGYRTINPAEMDCQNDCDIGGEVTTQMLRDAMKRDLVAICEGAKGIALLDGWEESSGARTEVALAEFLGIPAKPLSEWLIK